MMHEVVFRNAVARYTEPKEQFLDPLALAYWNMSMASPREGIRITNLQVPSDL